MNDPLDDLLDTRLREEMTYVDDGGFTARILQRLPARPAAAFSWQRSIVIFCTAVVSVIVAYFASGEGWFLREGLVRAIHLSPIGMLAFALAFFFIFTAGGLWAALNRTRDPLL